MVTFTDETVQPKNLLIGGKKLCHLLKNKAIGAVIILNNSKTDNSSADTQVPQELQQILNELADVFKEPDQLPPMRSVDHAIPLLDETKTVNQRQYRMPHHKKNAMEALIKQLLEAQKIIPSVSPYSSLVILVKKKDGTWILCVDWQLNCNTQLRTNTPFP